MEEELGIIETTLLILLNNLQPRQDAEYAGRKAQRISGARRLLLRGHPQRLATVARAGGGAQG
ncbi:hypothetical protein AERO8C_40044 [Aeromonas veronii]|uniref:Uncharacterized protein n=1 Tax=Aeromonas veronii TaxID=654 RepID=A0A653L6A1_AERVE|nr:hypothetical protein AERO8C_40044 [Aeromonas veronii]